MAQSVSGRGVGEAGGAVSLRFLHLPYLAQIGRDLVDDLAGLGVGVGGEVVGEGKVNVEDEVVV